MFDPLQASVLAAVLAIVVLFVWKRRASSKDAGKRYPPSIPALPFLGSIPFFTGGLERMHIVLMRKAEQLGSIIRLYAGGSMAVSLNGKEAIVNALLRHAETFGDRLEFWTEVNILNPDLRGIIFSHWSESSKHYHKLTLSIFKEFGFGINQEMDARISQEVEEMITEIRKQNGRPFDAKSALTYATSNVIMTILFGSVSHAGMKRSKLIDDSSDFITNLDTRIGYAPFIRFLPAFRKKIDKMADAQKHMFEQFEVAIEHGKRNPTERNFLTRFLEIEGPGYDHQELLFILRDLCLASADTVGATALWFLVEVANNAKIRSRLQREIDEVCGGDRLPSIDDKPRLPYTEAALNEVMRRHTLVYNPIPRVAMKDAEVNGYLVPRGCVAISNLYSAHMNAKDWGDPETFRPERFLDEDNNLIRRNDIVAFGLGKRSCIGEVLARQESFLFIASLAKHFDILPPDDQNAVTVSEVNGLVITPSPFKIRLIPRC